MLPSFSFPIPLTTFLFISLQILGKCEFLNPGGSVKDRVAVQIIQEVKQLLSHLLLFTVFHTIIRIAFSVMECQLFIHSQSDIHIHVPPIQSL